MHNQNEGHSTSGAEERPLRIGWAETDLTPEQPVLLAGQFYARMSGRVVDPLTATVWVTDTGDEHTVWVSCDLISIADELRDAVRDAVAALSDGPRPDRVVLQATHTHTAPETRTQSRQAAHLRGGASGVDLDAMPIEAYNRFAVGQLAGAIEQAWLSRSPGAVAFGVGTAVVGRNRRWVNAQGESIMYRLEPAVSDTFRHIEGFEDHSVQLAAVYDQAGELSGIVVNIACPSQTTEHEFAVSADFWHEARIELRKRWGPKLYVLAQCSAAGDQAPRPLYRKREEQRMLELHGRTGRQEIARRIADAVSDVLPAIRPTAAANVVHRHLRLTLALPVNPLDEETARQAETEALRHQADFAAEMEKIRRQPDLRQAFDWYRAATNAYGRMVWNREVAERARRQRSGETTTTVELHIVRLGDMAFATNPFELYLDYGTQIQTRSPAIQTFLVQLAGAGTYMPSARSVAGGGYGSVPASNPVGPDGGQQLTEATVSALQTLWEA